MKKKTLFISLFAIVMVALSFQFNSDKRNLVNLVISQKSTL